MTGLLEVLVLVALAVLVTGLSITLVVDLAVRWPDRPRRARARRRASAR